MFDMVLVEGMFHFLTCSLLGLMIVRGGGPLVLLALDFAQEDAGLRPAGSLSFWEIISSTTPMVPRGVASPVRWSCSHAGMSQASC